MNQFPPWAHSLNGSGQRHQLADHLRSTAALAGQFGREFGAEKLCYGAGLTHDVGKIQEAWQAYLLASEAWKQAGKPWPRPHTVNHKSAGAALLKRLAKEPGRVVGEGHHGGMPDAGSLPGHDDSVNPDRDRAVEEAARLLLPELNDLLDGPDVVPALWRDWARTDHAALEMAFRLTHSALVDADFLDTAAHFNATEVRVRPEADFSALADRFHSALRGELTGRTSSPIDGLRASLLDDCLAAAAEPPGVFRLPAPTGSGKTISAAAFALAHAARHNLKRVIVAVPFLSITEQNAAVYRRLLGDETVLEHHSGVDPLQEAKNGAENWDAPFVITTTAQLFESMFSNRPARTRKLHRLPNAVIILDEVQAVPSHVLPVILDGLRILQEHFGTTFLLSSATQPTWDTLGPWRRAENLCVRDIVANPPELYAGLRRSTVEWETAESIEAIAELIAVEPRAMIVVNSTANSRRLAQLVHERKPEGTFHLSTRMYAGHRRAVLARVRERLRTGLEVRLISTQLVEAGVDLDFPVVFRALGPAENLSQARGRCNREGLLKSGRFIVLDCPELVTLKAYEIGIRLTVQHFRSSSTDLDDPEEMRRYYRDLYASLGFDEFEDAARIQKHRERLHYNSVARDFRMIDDDSTSLVVASAPGAEEALANLSLRLAANGAPDPDRFRRLQEFTATLPKRATQGLTAYIKEELPGIWVWRGAYDDLTGVSIGATPQDTVW